MKVLRILGVIVLTLLLIVLLAGIYIKTILPSTGEPEAIQIERTPQRIERGEYLANHVTVCMDCHGTRDWSLFSGPMVPDVEGAGGEVFSREQGFPGTFYAPNITPHHLGDWTDGELLRAITAGQTNDHRALFPLMGYLRFGKMDVEDVYSIIAYIRTLKPVEHTVPARDLDFPLNFLVNTMPQPASFSPRPDPSDKVKYGAYLVNAAGCVDCHSQTEKGKIIPGTEYGGGMEFPQPAGIARSANITPDPETGIGNWTEEQFVALFRSFTDSSYIPRKMRPEDVNTPMPWSMYGGMTTSDLSAIYTYLRSLQPLSHKVVLYEKKN